MSKPTTPKPGRSLDYDFPGILVGCAEYDDGPTGCTAVRLPAGALVTVDIRGGSPAVVMGLDGVADAVCFAGGSLYGLEAVSGVLAALGAGPGGSVRTDFESIPTVRGAAIYDFRGRENSVHPDRALGVHAVTHAAPGTIPLGPVGAGRAATVGKLGEPEEEGGKAIAFREGGGQGAASGWARVDADRSIRVLVLTVVNAVGGIVDRAGAVVRGHRSPDGPGRLRAAEILAREDGGAAPARGNTTLSLVAIDRFLPDFYARQVARQIHSSMARALDPFHTETDGDVLMLVRADPKEGNYFDLADADDWGAAARALGIVGSELMWDAVLGCYQAE